MNLVTVTAICGDLVRSPVASDDLCANCSRLYRHIIPDYIEEFTFSLRSYVNGLELVPCSACDIARSGREAGLRLQELYGGGVLPDDLLTFYNCGLARFAHACDAGAEENDVRKVAFDLLFKYVLFIEEHPVVTRFWLFTSCVNALLRMRLLNLPVGIWKLAHTKPQKQNQSRLDRFKHFYSCAASGKRRKQRIREHDCSQRDLSGSSMCLWDVGALMLCSLLAQDNDLFQNGPNDTFVFDLSGASSSVQLAVVDPNNMGLFNEMIRDEKLGSDGDSSDSMD